MIQSALPPGPCRSASPGSCVLDRIIATFATALHALGARPSALELEQLGVFVHGAMSGSARVFHGPEHIFDVLAGGMADGIETLAILFHDVVYLQVDSGFPARAAMRLERVLEGPFELAEGHYRVPASERVSRPARLVFQIFGLQAGDDLSPAGGLNELSSALLAAESLFALLPEHTVAAVVACIEATIPFRGSNAAGLGPFDHLAARLQRLDGSLFDAGAAAVATRRALRVANSDVASFALPETHLFLARTWQLLPEQNPTLRNPAVCGIHDYRRALATMNRQLEGLCPNRIFHSWSGAPEASAHARALARAEYNLRLGTRYLGVQVYATTLLEALALATGGDSSLELWSQGQGAGEPFSGLPPMGTLRPSVAADADPALVSLLQHGRSGGSPFDRCVSALARFLYAEIGERRRLAAVGDAQRFDAGLLTADGFLNAQPPPVIARVARAAAILAVTRAEALGTLANQADARNGGAALSRALGA